MIPSLLNLVAVLIILKLVRKLTANTQKNVHFDVSTIMALINDKGGSPNKRAPQAHGFTLRGWGRGRIPSRLEPLILLNISDILRTE